MTADLKAARARLENLAGSAGLGADVSTVLTALDQAAEALKPSADYLVKLDPEGVWLRQVDVKFPLEHIRRAATVYATLKPADTKEGEG